MNSRASTTSAILLGAAAVVVIGCGGGGGSSGGGGNAGGGLIGRAPNPNCGGIVVKQASSQGAFNSKFIVPHSTIERNSDVGVRLHTNYLINPHPSANSRAPGPSGLYPSQVRNLYGVTGAGQGAIAIVDAYHSATSLGDFNTFSTQFGLPTELSLVPTASTNTVFQVVYATGSKPTVDTGWSQEIALDIEWAHAMAPSAKIYLVEAASSNLSDLMSAVNVAKTLSGVQQVSMSFGGTETSCEFASFDQVLVANGVTFFGASGDTPAEKDFPALSNNCISVGGTSLALNPNGSRASEIVWNAPASGSSKASGTGGALSAFEPRPVFQDGVIGKITGYRSGNDISADGDPNSGVAVYTGTSDSGLVGWLVVGGTSLSTPLLAGMVNASGKVPSSSDALNTYFYNNIGTTNFYDVTQGTNGSSAGTGWDVPSGVGAPLGPNAF